MEGHALLKKVRDALESLKGCMDGRNKEDVEKAISMVSLFCHCLFLVVFTCDMMFEIETRMESEFLYQLTACKF